MESARAINRVPSRRKTWIVSATSYAPLQTSCNCACAMRMCGLCNPLVASTNPHDAFIWFSVNCFGIGFSIQLVSDVDRWPAECQLVGSYLCFGWRRSGVRHRCEHIGSVRPTDCIYGCKTFAVASFRSCDDVVVRFQRNPILIVCCVGLLYATPIPHLQTSSSADQPAASRV